MTPLQKQQNPISKHRYVQAPKGFFGYRKINWRVVKIHPPVTSLGKFVKIVSAKVQLLDSHSRNSNFSMDRTACWQCCSGPSPRERDTDTDGVCYAAILQEIQTQCVSADLAVPAEATGLSTSTSLVMQNVPLS